MMPMFLLTLLLALASTAARAEPQRPLPVPQVGAICSPLVRSLNGDVYPK